MIDTHKIHHLGLSGIVFAACGRIWGNRLYAPPVTRDDREVTCHACKNRLAVIQSKGSYGRGEHHDKQST